MKEKPDLEGLHFIYPALPIEDLAPELRAALPRDKADKPGWSVSGRWVTLL